MSGDVGRACSTRPGYMGYVPSGTVHPTETSTLINRRLPLSERLAPSQVVKHDVVGPTLDPSKSSYFQKRGCITSLYGTTTGQYHGSPDRAKLAVSVHSAPNSTVKSVPYETNTQGMTNGYAQVDKANFMSSLQRKELDAVQATKESAFPPTRSSAKATLPSIRVQTVRKACNVERPNVGFHKLERRGPTLSVTGVVESCPDVKMFAEAPKTVYQTEIGEGRQRQGRFKTFPGYQGHVPQTAFNQFKQKNDIEKLDNKANTLASAPCRAMPGYGGHIPQSIFNDRGREGLKPALVDTSAGLTASHVALDEFQEREMNKVVGGKNSAVRRFFTAGPYADHSISDQFYVRYRPYEGFMKGGPSNTSQWIADKDLRINVL